MNSDLQRIDFISKKHKNPTKFLIQDMKSSFIQKDFSEDYLLELLAQCKDVEIIILPLEILSIIYDKKRLLYGCYLTRFMKKIYISRKDIRLINSIYRKYKFDKMRLYYSNLYIYIEERK